MDDRPASVWDFVGVTDADNDGWRLDDALGVSPIDDTKQAAQDAADAANPFKWVSTPLEKVGGFAAENMPAAQRATLAMGLGMASLGALTLVGGGVITYAIVQQLGSGRNTGKLIDAYNPTKAIAGLLK